MKGILFGLLIFPLTLMATDRVDSLKALLVISTAEEKIDLYIKLSEEFRMTSTEQALANLEYAYSAAQKAGDLSLAARILSKKAQLQQDFQLYQDAISTNNKAAALYDSLGDYRRGTLCILQSGMIYYNTRNFLSSLSIFKSVLSISKGKNFKKIEAFCLSQTGNVYYEVRNFRGALNYYEKALKLNKIINDDLNIATNFYQIGSAYTALNNYDKAIEHYLNAQELNRSQNDVEGLAMVYHAMGIVYEDLKNYKRALEYHLEALKFKESVKNKYFIASCLNSIASNFYELGNSKKTKSYLKKAEEFSLLNELDAGLILTYDNIGRIISSENKDIGLKYLKKAKILNSKIKDLWLESRILIHLGSIESSFEKRLKYLSDGLDSANAIETRDLTLEAYYEIAEVYKFYGNFKEAYDYLTRYNELKENIQIQSVNRVADMQLRYETAIRDGENILLRKKNEEQGLKIQQQQTRLWQLYLSLIFFSLFLGVGYYHFYKKIINNRYLFQKLADAELKQKEAEQFLVHRAALTTLGELAAGIIHDLKQPLQDIKLSVEDIQQGLGEPALNETGIQEALDDINNDVERMTTLTDYVILSANKKVYEKQELFNVNSSISNAYRMVRKQLMRQRLNLVLSLQDEIPNVRGNPWKFEQVLINLISNSAHAVLEVRKYKPLDFKEKLIIRTFKVRASIVISVEDNGIGVVKKFRNIMFYPFTTSKKPGEGSGLGLSIVYNVVREMQGRLDCKSTPFVGTRIQLIFPSEK